MSESPLTTEWSHGKKAPQLVNHLVLAGTQVSVENHERVPGEGDQKTRNRNNGEPEAAQVLRGATPKTVSRNELTVSR
jgi:hypothetical protein